MYKDVLSPTDEDFGFTKVCISRKITDLDYDLWCDSLGKERKRDLEPFVMIRKIIEDSEVWLSIKISDNPYVICGEIADIKGLDGVFKYIKVHKNELLMHWFGEIDDLDLLNILYTRGRFL